MKPKEEAGRRVRTPPRGPAPIGQTDPAPGAEDAPEGRTGPLDPAGSPVSNGRAPDGRFGPSNRFGKGNPNARRIHELRQMFLEAIEPATVVALAKRLQVQALQGDLDAMKMLLEHAIGRAPQAVEVTGADGGNLGLNITAVTAIVLDALAGDPAKRIEVVARLMELSDAGDDDAHA